MDFNPIPAVPPPSWSTKISEVRVRSAQCLIELEQIYQAWFQAFLAAIVTDLKRYDENDLRKDRGSSPVNDSSISQVSVIIFPQN